MRPAFLDQHEWWSRSPRAMQSRADYAYAGRRYVHERSWQWCDRFAAGVLVGVLAALLMGVI